MKQVRWKHIWLPNAQEVNLYINHGNFQPGKFMITAGGGGFYIFYVFSEE